MTAVAQLLDAVGALVNSSNAPTFNDSNSGVLPKGYQFPQASTRPIVLKARAEFFSASTATLKLSWYSLAGSVAGNVTWQAEVAAVTPGDALSVEGKGYATAQSATSAVNATAKGEQQTSITLVNLDGLADNDDLWIRISRTDTSMVGDAVLFDATLIYDDGQAAGGDVVGPASSVDNAVVRFDLATGKVVQSSGVFIDDSNNITGVGTLNTRVIATLATGPGSSTAGRVATFADAGGLVLANGPRLEADLVAGPASVVASTLAQFSGTTGKLLSASGISTIAVVTGSGASVVGNVPSFNNTGANGVSDSGRVAATLVDGPASAVSGNIMSFNGTTGKLSQDSGVSATAHAARHNPGGADAMFTSTWAANDAPVWNGTIWVPKRYQLVELSATATGASGAAANTFVDVPGLSIAIPRAGTYRLFAEGRSVTTGTAGIFYFSFGFSGTTTRISASGVVFVAGTIAGWQYPVQIAVSTAGATALASVAGGGTQALASYGLTMNGLLVASTTGNVTLRCARVSATTTTPTITCQPGMSLSIQEI